MRSMHSDRRNTIVKPQQMRDQLGLNPMGRFPQMPPLMTQPRDERPDPQERSRRILVWIIGAQAFALFWLLLALITR